MEDTFIRLCEEAISEELDVVIFQKVENALNKCLKTGEFRGELLYIDLTFRGELHMST